MFDYKTYYEKNKKKIKKQRHEYYLAHKADLDAKHRIWKQNNPLKVRQIRKRSNQKPRQQIFLLLGGKCSNPDCLVPGGCRDVDCLQIDHKKKGNGAEERRMLRQKSGAKYLKYILSQILRGSNDYQLLCANCNVKKKILQREF